MNEQQIDNYFGRVKQNPPLMDIEKVRQILAEAETKVKKGHRNLLKITIMTTIFAIIISAFLFWPDAPDKIQNSSRQIPNKPAQIVEPDSTVKEITVEKENNISIHGNKTLESKETEVNEKIPKNTDGKNLLASIIEEKDSVLKNIGSIEPQSRYPRLDSLQTINKPKQEYIYPEQILDSTLFIELSREELETLGFRLNNGAINLFFLSDMFASYFDGRLTFGVISDNTSSPTRSDTSFFQAKQMQISISENNTKIDQEGIIPMLITNWEGESLLKMGISELKLKTLFSKDLKTLLPVVIKRNTFYHNLPQEDVVYWFIPTDEFLNRLPQNIRKELLPEYDYITAEDKSALVKPECKYFDECRNTLNAAGFKVYPNPAESQVTVSFTLNEAIEGRILLVDIAGHERQVLQPQTSFAQGTHRINIDVSAVPEGIYLITLYSDKGVQTQRVIITR